MWSLALEFSTGKKAMLDSQNTAKLEKMETDLCGMSTEALMDVTKK